MKNKSNIALKLAMLEHMDDNMDFSGYNRLRAELEKDGVYFSDRDTREPSHFTSLVRDYDERDF